MLRIVAGVGLGLVGLVYVVAAVRDWSVLIDYTRLSWVARTLGRGAARFVAALFGGTALASGVATAFSASQQPAAEPPDVAVDLLMFSLGVGALVFGLLHRRWQQTGLEQLSDRADELERK